MDPHTIEEIEKVDRRISFLNASLSDVSVGHETPEMAELHRQTESEIQEQQALLRVLLKDKPRPWYYHRLPRELLAQIFKWITHPGDQVNLRRAFLGVGELMKWDSVDLLYFKRIYPLVQYDLWTDWRDIWRLCQVSPEFMDVVLHHFEIALSDYPTLVERVQYNFSSPENVLADITAFADECDDLGRTEWMTNMPFLVGFDFYCSSLDDSAEFLAKFLDAHGQKVWSCEVDLGTGDDDPGSPDLTGFLCKILKRTPNVVHFEILFYNDNHNAVLRAPDSLPYLPRLRSLCCGNLASSEPFIQKHAAQLKSFTAQGFTPVFQNVSFRNLWYYCSRNLRELQVVVPVPRIVPDSIRESPLQSVWLFLSEDVDMEVNHKLPAALISLSHFENTLLILTLEFDMDSPRNSIVTGEEWTRRVRLPKLSSLSLVEYQGKLDWLVALPSLHTLSIQDYNRRAKADVGERTPDLIHVSTNRITRFHTNIWTQLPNLRQLNIQNSEWLVCKSSFEVTREEHEAYENGSEFQKSVVTILAVLREIGAFFESPPLRLSRRDLDVFIAFGIFIVVCTHFYEYFNRNVQCFSLGFTS